MAKKPKESDRADRFVWKEGDLKIVPDDESLDQSKEPKKTLEEDESGAGQPG